MLTVQLAEELRDMPIVVNSVSPGYVKTDLTGHDGSRTAENGAKLPAQLASACCLTKVLGPPPSLPWTPL